MLKYGRWLRSFIFSPALLDRLGNLVTHIEQLKDEIKATSQQKQDELEGMSSFFLTKKSSLLQVS